MIGTCDRDGWEAKSEYRFKVHQKNVTNECFAHASVQGLVSGYWTGFNK